MSTAKPRFTAMHAACYGLLASALMLSGLLMVRMGAHTQQAEAAMVVNGEAFTLMTAQTSNQEESLFVLNNLTGQLIVYKVSLGGRDGQGIQPMAGENLTPLFDNLRGGGNTQNNRRGR